MILYFYKNFFQMLSLIQKGSQIISGFFFCLCLLPLSNEAESEQWSAKEIQSLFIQARALKLNVKHTEAPFYTIKAHKDFSFKNEKGVLKIQSKDFSKKKLWSDYEEELELSISGPSRLIEVFASSSKISVLDWKSSIFISTFKSDIQLQNIEGKSQIDLYEGQAYIKNHKGDLKFKSFQAALNLIDSKGVFDFQANQGALKIKNSAGELDFVGHNLKLQISNFNGAIKGFTESGEIKASLKPQQLELKTGTAPVRLYTRGQGVQVNAYTKEGQIYAPRYLNKKYEGKSIRVSGRIRSRVKTGNLKVETNRGKIYIQ